MAHWSYKTDEERLLARRAARKKWEVLYPDKWELQKQNQRLKRRYGITLDTYNQFLINQKGLCAICGKHQIEIKRRLDVDHCHTTGKIRGLLCTNCNRGIGYFYENLELLDRAKEYIIATTS